MTTLEMQMRNSHGRRIADGSDFQRRQLSGDAPTHRCGTPITISGPAGVSLTNPSLEDAHGGDVPRRRQFSHVPEARHALRPRLPALPGRKQSARRAASVGVSARRPREGGGDKSRASVQAYAIQRRDAPASGNATLRIEPDSRLRFRVGFRLREVDGTK